jgi:hypothetical protein
MGGIQGDGHSLGGLRVDFGHLCRRFGETAAALAMSV